MQDNRCRWIEGCQAFAHPLSQARQLCTSHLVRRLEGKIEELEQHIRERVVAESFAAGHEQELLRAVGTLQATLFALVVATLLVSQDRFEGDEVQRAVKMAEQLMSRGVVES